MGIVRYLKDPQVVAPSLTPDELPSVAEPLRAGCGCSSLSHPG